MAYVTIRSDHVIPQSSKKPVCQPLMARRDYFRLWLSEMHLQRDREWFKSWYPVVHTIVRLQFGGKQVEIPYVAGSLNLKDVDNDHLDRSIRINYPVTTLVPFNGDVVEIAGGLIAVQGTNSVNRLIKALGLFTGLLAPQLSSVLNVASAVADGVFELVDATDGQLKLGLHQTFVEEGTVGGNELVDGYFAAIAANQASINEDDFWVKKDQLFFGSDQKSLIPFTDQTYMLFKIEGRSTRNDWDKFASIDGPQEKAIESIWQGDKKKAKAFNFTACSAAATLPDLTATDHKRIPAILKDEFDAQLEQRTQPKKRSAPAEPSGPNVSSPIDASPSLPGEPDVARPDDIKNLLAKRGGLQKVVDSSRITVNDAMAMGDFKFEDIIPSWDKALQKTPENVILELKPEDVILKIEPEKIIQLQSELLPLQKIYPELFERIRDYTDVTHLLVRSSDPNLLKNSKVREAALRAIELSSLG